MRCRSPIFDHPIIGIIRGCKRLSTLKQVHAQMITTGLIHHTYLASCILSVSSSLSVAYGINIFNRVSEKSIFLCNTLISSICNCSHNVHTAIALYTRILYQQRVTPNTYTFPSLFKVFSSHSWLQHGRALHAHVLKFLGFNYDPYVQASLVNFYSKCGKFGISQFLFDQIRDPDLATWNIMLAAHSRSGSSSDATSVDGFGSAEDAETSMKVLDLFRNMQSTSVVRPNEVTLVALASACASLGALSQGIWVHVYLLKNKLGLNRYMVTALIDMYTKCGSLGLAYQLFDEFPIKDELCYNAMICGFAAHGHGHRALDLFERMKQEGLTPDDVTLAVAISACSHVGLVEEGRNIFDSMENDYEVKPKLEHYCCLVDLLGRAGRLEEAEERVKSMPMSTNTVLWRSLLGAAKLHGNSTLGETAIKHLIELEPDNSGNYVLLSNLYSRIEKWDYANEVRRLMKCKGVDKIPGSSSIEIDGVLHEFRMGDRSHPRSGRDLPEARGSRQ